MNNKYDSNDIDNNIIPYSHELNIVYPLNNQNNVVKANFEFIKIKIGFLICFIITEEDCECGELWNIKNKKVENHGYCILKAIFNSFKRFKDLNKNILKIKFNK